MQVSVTSPKLFSGEKWLVIAGLLGFVLAAFCGVWTLVYGGPVAPNGNLVNAISFDAAIGIFMLSTAAVSPLSAFGRKGRAFFRWSFIVLVLYAYFAETVQNFRGVNPRFAKGLAPFDQNVGGIFAFVALLLIIFYLVFAAGFFFRKASDSRPELVLGIRYAVLAVMISFAAGVWMSVNAGRFTGISGNIIWLHGLGFHALQAVPFMAWLTERTRLPARIRRLYVHAAGFSYLLGLAAIGWQTMNGRSVLEWSPLPLLACAFFLAGIAAGIAAFRLALIGPRESVPAGAA
ncbi:hypothetical protein [Paenibacillus humicola]|uniref:hypothetical protein n=1 Tax=Paenibacillus humicola TaxID=3110540 RepID=UPI00237C5053|nr:hypothetical protein [Paenibacillus humicola]